MERIEKIIKDSASKIKVILSGEIGKLESLPELRVGVREADLYNGPPYYIEGMLGAVNVKSIGTVQQKTGIMIHDDEQFWTKSNLVIMIPEGLYRFRKGMFKYSQYSSSAFPDWDSKVEVLEDYVTHARSAFNKIREIVVESKRRENSSHFDAQ